MMSDFGRVVEKIRGRQGSVICLGLDPRWEGIPREFATTASGGSRTKAETFAAYGCSVIELLKQGLAAVKIQSAFFELLGPPGLAALAEVRKYAEDQSIPVILDVKRGDIGTTAEAYAEACFGGSSTDTICACTVNPWMGSDAVRPFVIRAQAASGMVFLLVKTSNEGSRDFQDLRVDGKPMWEIVAEKLRQWGEEWNAGANLGAVVGATHPRDLVRAREILPQTLFLIPGYGAQGAQAKDLRGALKPDGSGILVNASRSLVFPWGEKNEAPRAWQAALTTALHKMQADLAGLSP